MKTIITQIDRAKQYQDLTEGDLIVDLVTEGRYWRTSKTLSLSLLGRDASGALCLKTLTAEKEADEYEILTEAAAELEAAGRIITFNGTSFDLPQLHRKYAAYGLRDPLGQKQYLDLYRALAAFAKLFALPKRSLDEHLLWLDPAGEHFENDALKTLRILPLLNYEAALRFCLTDEREQPAPKDAVCTCPESAGWSLHDGRLYFQVRVPWQFPKEASLHDGVFHLRFASGLLHFAMPCENGQIRIYHEDPSSYSWLPGEGYAVHNSMAAFLDASKKEPATKENCFHLTAFSEALFTEKTRFYAFLHSVCAYILSV